MTLEMVVAARIPLQLQGLGFSLSAWCPWFLFQTPYFWPTQQWPAEDTDYGNTPALPMRLVVLFLLLINLPNLGCICLQVVATFMSAYVWVGRILGGQGTGSIDFAPP